MIRIVVLSLLGVLIIPTLKAQGWIKTYEYNIVSYQNRMAVVQTPNNDLVVAGNAGFLTSVSRFSVDGDSIWTAYETEEERGFKQGADLINTQDGHLAYIVHDTVNWRVFLTKMSASGEVLWRVPYRFDDTEVDDTEEISQAHHMLQTENGDYIFAGLFRYQGTSKLWITRADSEGNELWSNLYSAYTIYISGLGGLVALPGGGFAVGGSASTKSSAEYDFSFFYFLEIDETGQEVNYRQYEEHIQEGYRLVEVNSFFSTQDGGFVYTGSSYIPNSFEYLHTLKLNADREVLWTKSGDHNPMVGIETDNGDLVLASGFSFEQLMRVNADFSDTLWIKNINIELNFVGAVMDLLQTTDGGFFLAGFREETSYNSSYIVKTNELGDVYTCMLNGVVFLDENEDCLLGDEIPRAGWMVRADKEGDDFYAYTTSDENGFYTLALDTGVYAISIIHPNTYYSSPCVDNSMVAFTEPYGQLALDIPLKAEQWCPLMTVDISSPFLRRCFSSNYIVSYCNEGTSIAENANLEVLLDPFISYQSSSIPLSQQNGHLLSFNLGDLLPGECQEMTITVNVSCDAELGQTHCTTANIFPDVICLPGIWAGPVIQVEASCEEDTAFFKLTNEGGNMSTPLEYIVTEDNIVLMIEPFQLQAEAFLEFSVPVVPGATYRLEAEQAAGFPALLGGEYTAVHLEGCNGISSGGFILQFPDDDESPFEDIECRENIGSYDPNDKQAFPLGFDEPHFIRPGTELEYTIRFQNTGTDTAFTVIIRDTLSENLDISTLQIGAASHDFTFRVYGPRILEFRFDNIMLPDSTVNEMASHGAINFSIDPARDLPLGTVIENKAGIYFDFNPPVITNTTWHTLGENFIVLDQEDMSWERPHLSVFPNPFSGVAFFDLNGEQTLEGDFLLFDSRGHLVETQVINRSPWPFYRKTLNPGIYFFQISLKNGGVYSGKIILL